MQCVIRRHTEIRIFIGVIALASEAERGLITSELLRVNGVQSLVRAVTVISGINNSSEVVGAYTVGTSNGIGFIYDKGTYNAPGGVGATAIFAVSNNIEIAGFYGASNGSVPGFIARPTSGCAATAALAARNGKPMFL